MASLAGEKVSIAVVSTKKIREEVEIAGFMVYLCTINELY